MARASTPERRRGVERKEWQRESFRLLVGNLKSGITGRVMPTFQGRQGGELYIKDIAIEVITNNFAGDLTFPRHWKVFGDVAASIEPTLTGIPDQIGGVKGEMVTSNGGLIPLKTFFAKPQIRKLRLAYANWKPHMTVISVRCRRRLFMNSFVNGDRS